MVPPALLRQLYSQGMQHQISASDVPPLVDIAATAP